MKEMQGGESPPDGSQKNPPAAEYWECADPDAVPVSPDLFAAESAAYIDAIVNTERLLAVAHRDRAVAIAAAQAFTERMVLPGIPVTGAQWDGYEVAARTLRAEVACALRVPEVTAAQVMLESAMLVLRLPQTLAMLGEGVISYQHARTVVDEVAALMSWWRVVRRPCCRELAV